MADMITLTPQPIRLALTNGIAQRQAIYLATDVSGYDVLDMELVVPALEGTTPQLAISVVTGMQVQTEDGWIKAGGFNSSSLITASNTSSMITIGNNSSSGASLLRYVRWDVTSFGGTSAFATFFIRGMARKLA